MTLERAHGQPRDTLERGVQQISQEISDANKETKDLVCYMMETRVLVNAIVDIIAHTHIPRTPLLIEYFGRRGAPFDPPQRRCRVSGTVEASTSPQTSQVHCFVPLVLFRFIISIPFRFEIQDQKLRRSFGGYHNESHNAIELGRIDTDAINIMPPLGSIRFQYNGQSVDLSANFNCTTNFCCLLLHHSCLPYRTPRSRVRRR